MLTDIRQVHVRHIDDDDDDNHKAEIFSIHEYRVCLPMSINVVACNAMAVNVCVCVHLLICDVITITC